MAYYDWDEGLGRLMDEDYEEPNVSLAAEIDLRVTISLLLEAMIWVARALALVVGVSGIGIVVGGMALDADVMVYAGAGVMTVAVLMDLRVRTM